MTTSVVMVSVVVAMFPPIVVIAVMFVPVAVKTAVVEIFIVLSFEIRAIVRIVPTVTIVALPYGVVIVNIPGELGFVTAPITLVGCRGIFIIVYGCRGRSCVYWSLLINYRGSRCIISGS